MDVYQIGIKIAMENGVSAVLSKIQRDLIGINKSVLEASAGFSRLGLAVKGALGIAIGGGMIKGILDLSKHGEKYTHELEAMKVAGMGVVEMQNSIAMANRVSSSVMSLTPAENLKTIQELRMALASADVRPGGKADPAMATVEAIRHLETFQKISGILSSTLSKDGKTFDGKGQAYELAKAAEMLGFSQNAEKFDTVLGGWTKAIISSGGKLQGSDFFANVKYLRGTGLGMSMEFLTEILPSLMQEMKTGKGSGSGGGAGNPLASLDAMVVGGVMQHKTVDAFKQLNMLDMTKVHELRGGKLKLDPGAMKDSNVAVENKYEFAKILMANMAKYTHYLDKDKTTGEFLHPGEMRAFMAAIAPNRTAQQILSIMAFQQNRIEGDRALQKSAFGIDKAHAELQRFDPDLVRKEFSKQTERLFDDLGKSISPEVTEIIYRLTKGLAYLSEVIERHPTATRMFFEVAGGIAAVLVVMGTAALTMAVVTSLMTAVPLITAGFMALGAAVFWLSTKVNIVDFIKERLGGISEALHTFMDTLRIRGWDAALTLAGKGFVGMMNDLQTSIISGLTNIVKSLAAWFAGFPGRILGAITGAPAQAGPAGTTGGVGTQPEFIAVDPTVYGKNFIRNPNATPGPPPAANSNTPGSSASNPAFVHQTNAVTGRDIANGVSTHQYRNLAGPNGSTTGYDQRMSPGFSLFGTP